MPVRVQLQYNFFYFGMGTSSNLNDQQRIEHDQQGRCNGRPNAVFVTIEPPCHDQCDHPTRAYGPRPQACLANPLLAEQSMSLLRFRALKIMFPPSSLVPSQCLLLPASTHPA